ncbi:MAG: hypothetical protein NVS2B16_33240 [Chloroflexota bacterium]
MNCPDCATAMDDVTDVWHTLAESEGAEYLASYVTIWRCPTCHTVAGTGDDEIEWVMEREEVLVEE